LLWYNPTVPGASPENKTSAGTLPMVTVGVRHALFPVLALGAPRGGAASFPTLFSTASGVAGLVAGPSNASRRLDY